MASFLYVKHSSDKRSFAWGKPERAAEVSDYLLLSMMMTGILSLYFFAVSKKLG